MGSTNSTTYYNLSQFIATDKPAWLQDYNGDMLKIDTAINGAKVAADAAQLAADAAQGDATTALGSIASISGDISAIQTTLGTAVGNINTINSLIGNGEPTTTDKTLIGAINELDSEVTDLESGMSAIHTRMSAYDINVNAAMVSADGVKTYSQLGDEVYAALNTLLTTLDDGEVIRIEGLDIPDVGYCLPDGNYVFNKLSTLPSSIIFIKLSVGVSFFYLHMCSLKSASSVLRNAHDDSGISYVDMAQTVPASGSMFLKISRYKKL